MDKGLEIAWSEGLAQAVSVLQQGFRGEEKGVHSHPRSVANS